MKFLQHGDSVVSLRFLYEVGSREVETTAEAAPEADTFEGLMTKVETGLDLVRSGDMTQEQAADAQITLFSLSRDHAQEVLSPDQVLMIADLDGAAKGILNPSEIFVDDTEIGSPELDQLSTQAINALTRILTIEPGGDPSSINDADLKIVENFAKALEGSADSPAAKDAYAQALSDVINERFPQFIGSTAILSSPTNLRNVVSDILAELNEMKLSEVEALKPRVNLEFAELAGDITKEGLSRDAKLTESGERKADQPVMTVASTVAELPVKLDKVLAGLGTSTAEQFNMDPSTLAAQMASFEAMQA